MTAARVTSQRLRGLRQISGRGGAMGKDGGSATTTSGVEAPNTLKSRQVARVIDLLGEGPIWGVCDPAGENYNSLKGVYFDGVAVQRSNGSFNFVNHSIQFARGYPTQAIMSGFAASENEQSVGVQLKHGFPITHTIINPDVDRCRVTVSVPSLQIQDKSTGNITGTYVNFIIQYNNNNGGWVTVGGTGYYYTISGKTSSTYQRAITFGLPRGGPWDIRVTRATSDSSTANVQNDLYWDSYTEITDDKVNYSNSAIVGTIIDAEQFRSIPKRTFDVKGLLIRIPSNMDPDTGKYSPAVWDGNFVFAWSNNPAWVLYDVITNGRYGLGDFIPPALMDKWSFYKMGQWCDALVPTNLKPPNPAKERRYICNYVISTQQEAFDLLQKLTSIFRGWLYWSGGLLIGGADQPEDPVLQFTNANVIDGQFTYSGGDIRQRHTQFAVGWKDPDQMGQGRLATAEDPDMVSTYGLKQEQFQAYGCTRETEAVRAAKWSLYTEAYEDEAIQFTAGLEGAYVKPGNIVKVMDANVAGRRRGGRVGAGSNFNDIHFDAPVYFEAGHTYVVSVVIVTGETATVQTRNAYPAATGYVDHLVVSSGFSQVPQPDQIFVITEPGNLEATLWRILSKKQADADKYQLEGVRHHPDKWDYVEKNHALSDPDTSDIKAKPDAVTNLKVMEYIIQTSAISLAVRANLSWTSQAPLFDVFWHGANENWQHLRTDQHAADLPVVEGPYTFQVTPIGTIGLKGPMSSLDYTVIGLSALPSAPEDFRVNVVDGVALFDWKPAPEIDVIVGGHYELRFTTQTSGATWNTAQTVIPSIPGSATSVETGYQVGTWLLRTFDITGRASDTWASIVALAPDGRYTGYYRICESPNFTGTHNGTQIKMPQQWLTIGATGGLWDSQLPNMSTWPDVDVLPVPAGETPPEPQGTYTFANTLDAGAPFSIRLAADLLAFPYYQTGVTVDERAGLVDTWENWDDPGGDLNGSVTILIRTTLDDPLNPAAIWTDWKPFIPGEYYARGFQFEAFLKAPVGQNIGVETLCITGDFRNKIDAGEDVPYPAVQTRVYFNIKFFTIPAVVITRQNTQSADSMTIPAKTREYFDINITGAGGAQVTRTFDWHAQGY